MMGPFPVVGDCVTEKECLAMAFVEVAPVHDGDLVVWFMPSREPGEQYAAKWLVEDSDGSKWICCKYFAVRYRHDFHLPVARVVKIISGDPGSMNPELSARMASQIEQLRSNPPLREDLVVFPEPLLDKSMIKQAIDQHRRQWAI